MNVGSATNSGNQFISLETEDTAQLEATTIAGKLAVLMLDTQEHQKELGRQQMASARQDFNAALADEVEAMRDQADAAFRGAIFAGATSIAAGGMGVWAAGRNCDNSWQASVATGLNKLSEPLGTMLGNTYAAAGAKSAQGAGEAAKWQLDDTRDALKHADELQNKALDWASSLVDRDAATMAAILSNKV